MPLMGDTENVNVDDEVLACADPKWKPDAQNMWTFEQIGEAFMEFGYKKFYKPGSVDALSSCVASLTIAAGECQETLQSLGIGCDAKATGDSGVFQLDYLLSTNTPLREKVLPQVEKDGNMMNLCISGFGAGFITGAPFLSKEKKAVATLQQTSLYTCMESPADVNDYSCPDPESKPGVIYPNFIGTFCHKSYLQRWSPCDIKSTKDRCCGLFNGGANSGELEQPPFPEYYYKKAAEHLKKMPKGKNFKTICEKIIKQTEAPSLVATETMTFRASREVCHVKVEKGDTCWVLKQTWNCEYSAIKNMRTGKTCADSTDLGWIGDPLDIINPPGGCSHGPPPPVPSPEYDGQFVFPLDKWKVWDYKAGAGRIGICFGGSSILKLNEDCDQGGKVWEKTISMTLPEGDKYYDFGGGDANEKQWITPELVAKLDGHMDTVKASSYQGIFYDIETFTRDFDVAAVLKALETSFSKAKSKGLKVMVSTSYLSPYNAYDDANYNKRVQELWRAILANKDVDIFSPQFYGDGVTAKIAKSWGMSIDFKDWTSAIKAPAKILPILKATSETYFKNQVEEMKKACSQKGQAFCDSGFLLWGSHK